MSDLKNLTGRLDAEFEVFRKGAEEFQVAAKHEYEARESRFQNQFVPVSRRVVDVIRPRLALLVERFKDRIDVTPDVREHEREVTLTFKSPLANINLSFRMTHDAEVKNLVLDEDLEILPILMKYEQHAGLSMPLDRIDEGAIEKWIDDRIVDFVQTVAALHRNQYYLKGHLVVDPIAGVQMPKYAAKSTLEAGGEIYYFISEETKAEFAKQRKLNV